MCLADRLGGVRPRANGERGHLRDHPGLLPGLRLQRRLQLAAVVKEQRRESLAYGVFISVKMNIIMVLLFGSFYLYGGRPPIDTPNQCNTLISTTCVCSTNKCGMEGKKNNNKKNLQIYVGFLLILYVLPVQC